MSGNSVKILHELQRAMKREWPSAIHFSAAACLFAVLIRFGAMPHMQKYAALRNEISRTAAMVEGERGRETLKDLIREKKRTLEAGTAAAAKQYGAAADLPGLLQLIFDRALQTGVGIDRAQPQESEGNGKGGYSIVLEAQGTYQNLAGFVSALEAMPHLVRIDRMSIDRGHRGVLEMKLLLTCFSLREATFR